MRAALIAVLASLSVPLAAHAAPACDAQIGRQAAGGPPAEAGCWRLGPVALGMSAEQVAKRIGPPDHEDAGPASGLRAKIDRTGYRDAFYVFPRDLAQRLARQPSAELRMRILQVSYFQGRAVRIASATPTRVGGDRCGGMRGAKVAGDGAAGFDPFRGFAGVREGDSVAVLRARLGGAYTQNRPGDFLNYWPVPLTVGVDPDRQAVSSFAIGADGDAVFLGGWANLEVARDPATCRITGFRFLSGDRR